MSSTASPAPKPKRSLFSRPAWAQPVAHPSDSQVPQGEANGTDDDVFTRSKDSFAEIRRQEELKRQRKAEKARLKAEQEDARQSDDLTSSSIKRRRITDADYERFGVVRNSSPKDSSAVHAGANGEGNDNENDNDDEDLDDDDDSSPVKPSFAEKVKPLQSARSPRSDKVTPSTRTARSAAPTSDEVVISIDSGDDGPATPPATRINDATTDAGQDQDSDEEFPELAAAARERRRKMDELAAAKSPVPPSKIVSFTGSDTFSTAPLPAPDPVLTLLVTSPITGTKPLLVKRKLSQRLQEVREVWCTKQGFDQTTSDSVFLIYKMRKLHDVTTCKSLGLRVDSEGQLLGAEQPREGQDPGNVALQAVTEEIFEQLKQERDAERQRKNNPDYHFESRLPPVVVKPTPSEPAIRIVLKSKGHSDYKLKVRKSTAISKIILACRNEWKLGADASIVLHFDGEELEPDSTVGDTDIDDMETIDVHIR